MILEVDCGNTLIKWRLLDSALGKAVFAGAGADIEQLSEQLAELPSGSVSFVRVVSVRAEGETQHLLEMLGCRFSASVKLSGSAPYLAGVSNGYLEPALLGADRWMAIIAAYEMAKMACLVLDVGTAVTSDFVSDDGIHLGGFICPGIRLMRSQLGQHTQRISYQSGARSDCTIPGRRTAEAVEHGTELMLIGFINTQLGAAERLLGKRYSVFLTGGDAPLVAAAIPDARVVPDLVFRGLALAIPE